MIYVVQSGDTLNGIAAKHGVSVQEIIDANANGVTDPNYIYVGQRLFIPNGEVAEIYIVKSGDTLNGIATTFNVLVSDIIRLNNLEDPNILYVGQQLRIPLPTEPGLETYVVQPGDTLYNIAQSFGVPVHALIKANNITDAGIIYVGQTLVIPMGPVAPVPPEEPQIGTYVVQSGDTLGAIAIQYGIPVKVLMAINNIMDPNMIYVGQVLLIPVLPEPGLAYHIVHPGDTINQLAQMYGVDPNEMMELNGITDPTTLYVGQVLLIPEVMVEPEPEPEPEEIYHTVQEGENFLSIAEQYGIRPRELADFNDMQLGTPPEPSTVLQIPPAAAA